MTTTPALRRRVVALDAASPGPLRGQLVRSRGAGRQVVGQQHCEHHHPDREHCRDAERGLHATDVRLGLAGTTRGERRRAPPALRSTRARGAVALGIRQ
ncbi:MAG: hypothetical protein ACRCXL_04860 [Dermatophilaceae bacterium]